MRNTEECKKQKAKCKSLFLSFEFWYSILFRIWDLEFGIYRKKGGVQQ
jgi:hypothetical protein